jgi:hypothetical protein
MPSWLSLWLFPLGLLGAVVLLSLNSVIGSVLSIAWGFVLVPHVGNYLLHHSHGRAHGSGGSGFSDVSTHYWRTAL